MVNYKSIITWRHVGFLWTLLEQSFIRVFWGSPQKRFTGGDVLNKRQQLRDAVWFKKNAIIVGFSWNKAVAEKLEMTVGLVQKNILLIVKTACVGSWTTSPPTAASIDADHDKNDQSRYSINNDALGCYKSYMPPPPRL